MMKTIGKCGDKSKTMAKWLVCFSFAILCVACTTNRAANYEKARLVRVVDGDTLLVDRGQGGEYLRLIGIDAPESVHPDPNRNSEEGRRSSAFLHKLLANVTTIYIVKDVSETDKYGRLLRYVWLARPSDKTWDIRTEMVNAIMLLEGYAGNVTIPPDVDYADLFVEFVREARENHLGLWD